MQYVQSILLILSSFMLLFIVYHSLTRRETRGARYIALISLSAVVWSVGSFLEINLVSYGAKLLSRNIQQLGVFTVPFLSLYFAADYARLDHLKKYINIIAATQLAVLALLFADGRLHLLRSGVSLVESDSFGKTLVITHTFLGTLLVSLNFALPFIALAVLLNYARKLTREYRSNTLKIVLAFFLTFLAALIKTVFLERLGVYLQISVLFIPGVFILFFTLIRYDFFRISPIARDKVFEVIDYGLLVVDSRHIIVEVNSFAESIIRKFTGYSKPLVGAAITEFYEIHPDIIKKHEAGVEFSDEMVCDDGDDKRYYRVKYYPLSGGMKKRIGYVLILNDVTEQKKHESRLLRRAERDELTGLLNRSGLFSAYDYRKEELYRSGPAVSFFMIDLDDFKKQNDTFGHLSGDKILCDFADVLKATLRCDDMICRFGGEEFVVILPYTDKNAAFCVAERIRQKAESRKVPLPGGALAAYTVSVGVTDNTSPARPLFELITEADDAMYRAKYEAKNKTVIYTPGGIQETLL